MKHKKLQVFISSTYTDLIEERQAAVEAVLECKHIPAGMELFTPGDETQMTVIKRWIEESDVYLLILGGRYGSIDPKSKKSYTQLEYEYALELEKPYFTVVIKEKALKNKVEKFGIKMQEIDKPKKLAAFRKKVTSGVIVKFFDDEKDIKLAIHKALSEFKERKEIVGWVRNQAPMNINQLTSEITRLKKENANLLKEITAQDTYENCRNFEQIYDLLVNDKFSSDKYEFKDYQNEIQKTLLDYNLKEFNSLAYFIFFADSFNMDNGFWHNHIYKYTQMLRQLRLVKGKTNDNHFMTEDGRKFYRQLLRSKDTKVKN